METFQIEEMFYRFKFFLCYYYLALKNFTCLIFAIGISVENFKWKNYFTYSMFLFIVVNHFHSFLPSFLSLSLSLPPT